MMMRFEVVVLCSALIAVVDAFRKKSPPVATPYAAEKSFVPIEAVMGGVFIGVASGVSMITSSRVAGCSGALKSLVLADTDGWKVGFVAGLTFAGASMGQLLPALLEDPPAASIVLGLGGLAVGTGTSWANGCTSGHGLAGLSRLSFRSLVAVPTFMAVAITTRTMQTGLSFSLLPVVSHTKYDIEILMLAIAFAALLALILFFAPAGLRNSLLGLWSGGCFGTGLVVGGMARPSAVTGALSPSALDLTLWALFMTALGVTFLLYRAAEASGIKAARSGPQGAAQIDNGLVVGSGLFGVGWALTGLCPGPLAVGLGAQPTAPGMLLVLATFAIGVKLTTVVKL